MNCNRFGGEQYGAQNLQRFVFGSLRLKLALELAASGYFE